MQYSLACHLPVMNRCRCTFGSSALGLSRELLCPTMSYTQVMDLHRYHCLRDSSSLTRAIHKAKTGRLMVSEVYRRYRSFRFPIGWRQ